MGRLSAVGIAVLVASIVLGAGSTAGAAPGLLGVQDDFDRVQFRIAVDGDGTGEWTFRYERRLENASERRQFAAFAERFRTNETTTFRDFRAQAITLVKHGSRSTGRNMSAGGFERNATIVTRLNTLGVVEMRFSWAGFAATDGDRVIVGDVFQGGLYLGASQSLVIEAGDGLRFRSVEPAGTLSGSTLADSETVTWQGERTFADNHPRVVLERGERAGGGALEPTATTDGRSGGDASPSARGTGDTPADVRSRWLVPALSGIAVLVGVGLAILWYRSGAPGDTDAEVEEVAPGDGAVVDDRERVDGLLRERDGRMRQSAIVEETGWSKSKVSMVLSEMEEDGEITKLRVGRENLISLPGHEPDAARSPHDRE